MTALGRAEFFQRLFRAGVALALLSALAAPAATRAQPTAAAEAPPTLDLTVPREPVPPNPAPCTSIVQRACAIAPQSADTPSKAPGLKPTHTADQVLERIVIEGERLRRPPTVREVIETATARQTWWEMESGEGGRCMCAKPCPPWPQACCLCTKGGRDAKINNLVRH